MTLEEKIVWCVENDCALVARLLLDRLIEEQRRHEEEPPGDKGLVYVTTWSPIEPY